MICATGGAAKSRITADLIRFYLKLPAAKPALHARDEGAERLAELVRQGIAGEEIEK
jgi:hypothetical protein